MAETAELTFKAKYIRPNEVDFSGTEAISLSPEVKETIRKSGIASLQVLLGSEPQTALKRLAIQYWASE